MAAQFAEMDDRVTFLQQLQQDAGPVVLINKFNVAAEDADRLLQAWADDTAFMKQQPGHLDPAPPWHRRKHHLRQRCRLGIGLGARSRIPLT